MHFTCANFDVKVGKKANFRVRAKHNLIWSKRRLQWHIWPCSLTYRQVTGNGLFHYLCRGVVFTVIAPSINARPTCWYRVVQHWPMKIYRREILLARWNVSQFFIAWGLSSARRWTSHCHTREPLNVNKINYYMDTPILIIFWTETAVTSLTTPSCLKTCQM